MSPARIPFMAAALVALVAGVWAGLLRMGWRERSRGQDEAAQGGRDTHD